MKSLLHLAVFASMLTLGRAEEPSGPSTPLPDARTSQVVAEAQKLMTDNPNVVRSIFEMYGAYLKTLTGVSDEPPAPNAPSSTASAPASTPAAPVTAPAVSPLRLSGLQPSGQIEGAHFDGYPFLPAGSPTVSILQPTDAQLRQAAEVAETIRKRKRELMERTERKQSTH